ncbi:acyl-CoA dehydrogenase family protein [Kineococcus arenarius]|uniref:acyl-CoA dehydrogenase family protein n=1 Tax=Kineococcus sp. SYSU DK007 TaxID=3383128 RepID=UPI003D7EB684
MSTTVKPASSTTPSTAGADAARSCTSADPARSSTADGPALLPPTSADAVLANTAALLPLIAEEADGIEAAARLTPRAERAMRAAGVFEMGFPASRGGLEMTLEQQVAVVATIAAVDASAGWNVGVLNAGGYYAGRLEQGAYDQLYPTRDMPTSGSFHPRGRAQRVDGGYLVSGHWDWGSGSYTAEHIVGGALVFDGEQPLLGADGKQVHLGMWLPREAIEPAHNWQTLGVRGSGSTSFDIRTPAFVPTSHAFDREAPYRHEADPLNRSVKICHFALTGVVLGIARHLLTTTGRLVRARGSRDTATVEMLGEAMGEVDFAEAGVREIARRTDEIIFSDTVLTEVDEARMTAANAVAASALRRVITATTELASARYVMDADPLQRILRDALSALAHAGTRRKHLGPMAQAALAQSSGHPWTAR